MTSTFLFLAYLGFLGRLFMVSLSVFVSNILRATFLSMNGAMSACVPQRAFCQVPFYVYVRFFERIFQNRVVTGERRGQDPALRGDPAGDGRRAGIHPRRTVLFPFRYWAGCAPAPAAVPAAPCRPWRWTRRSRPAWGPVRSGPPPRCGPAPPCGWPPAAAGS